MQPSQTRLLRGSPSPHGWWVPPQGRRGVRKGAQQQAQQSSGTAGQFPGAGHTGKVTVTPATLGN